MPETAPASNAPWLDGYDSFFAREIGPLLDTLEADRAAARKAFMGRALTVGPIVVGLAILGLVLFPDATQFVLFGAIALGALAFGYASGPLRAFARAAKQQLVTRICGFFDLEFRINPTRNPTSRLRELKLVPSYDRSRSKCEDQVLGTYENVELELTDLHLREERGSGKNRRVVTTFKGPAMRFSFPKRFNGTTLIRRDATALGNWLADKFSSMDRIRLEDPEFERHFEVYGTDQVEARYLLTPGFMTRLMDLTELLGKQTQAAFADAELLITANNHDDRFEIKVWSSGGSIRSQADRFVRELTIVFEIVHVLNLRSQTRL